MREALGTGAHGYVVKIDAGRELLIGVSAVVRGHRFVSKRFSGEDFVVGAHSGVSEDRPTDGSCVKPQQDMEIPRSHEVEFYSDDAAFVVGFTLFIDAALEAGNAVIVIATESHRKSLLQRLQEHGVDVAAAVEQGRYVSLDVADTLSTFMMNDLPDPVRCLKVAGDLLMEPRNRRNLSLRVLQSVVNVRLFCGRKGRWMLRFRSNTSGMKSPGSTE